MKIRITAMTMKRPSLIGSAGGCGGVAGLEAAGGCAGADGGFAFILSKYQEKVGCALASAAAAEESSVLLRTTTRRCIKLNTTGTNKSVATVAMKRPPITA